MQVWGHSLELRDRRILGCTPEKNWLSLSQQPSAASGSPVWSGASCPCWSCAGNHCEFMTPMALSCCSSLSELLVLMRFCPITWNSSWALGRGCDIVIFMAEHYAVTYSLHFDQSEFLYCSSFLFLWLNVMLRETYRRKTFIGFRVHLSGSGARPWAGRHISRDSWELTS